MQVNSYVCFNGEFRRSNEPGLHTLNRGFRYNDALTENIHANATEAQFVELHLERLAVQMQQLSMDVPLFLNSANIKSLITNLLNKNRIFGGAHIRLTVLRNDGEEIIPSGNKVSFIIESTALPQGRYMLNEKGLTVAISQSYTRHSGGICSLYRPNVSLFMLASIEAVKTGVDRMILLNESGRLTEATDSNIFLVSGNSLFTPAPEQGCIDGVMRKIILNCALNAGFRVNDQSSLTSSALYDAEELFLTNAVQGIQWAGAFQQKRYFNKTARMLNGLLNNLAFE